MGEYYIQKPDELYHYGVRGMKWGVRKQGELVGRRSSGVDSHYREQRRQKIKRTAVIGAAVAATALAGYGVYKMSKVRSMNKASHAAVKRILARNSTQNFVRNTANNMWGFDGSYKSNPYSLRPGRYSQGKHYNGSSTFHYYSNNGIINNGGHRLTGHSSRLTKAGAASYRGGFYSKRAAKAPLTSDYFSNPNTQRRVLEKQANDAWTELGNIQRSSIASGKGVPKMYKRTKVTRLTRQKGPRILRVRG